MSFFPKDCTTHTHKHIDTLKVTQHSLKPTPFPEWLSEETELFNGDLGLRLAFITFNNFLSQDKKHTLK